MEPWQRGNAIEACYPIMGALHKLESKWNADKHAAYGQLDLPLNYVVNRIESGEVCLLCATSMSEWGFTPIERLRIADCQRELEEVITGHDWHGRSLRDGAHR